MENQETAAPSQAEGVQAALDKMSGVTAPETPEPAAEAAAPSPEPEQTAPEETQVEDIWAGVPEKARKEFEDLQNKIRSDDGRVNKAMNELKEVQAELAKFKEKAKSEPTVEKESALAKDYPEAQRWQDVLTKQEQTIKNLQDQLQNLAVGALDASRPGWREMIETPAFKQWLVVQDSETQAKFHSANLSDNISLLDAYKSHDDGKKQAADSVKQERTERLESAQSATARPSSGMDTRPVDPEAGFQEALRRVKAKHHLK